MALSVLAGLRRYAAAVHGALGFLSRLPVRAGEPEWDAFRTTPAAFPIAGYPLGALVAIPFVLPAIPAPTVAVSYLAAVYLLTGVAHVDGLADVCDAAVVHGDRERRRDVLKDSRAGVGAVLGVSLVLLGLALGAFALASASPVTAVGVVLAAEVGAKAGMASLSCVGTTAHRGLGSQLVSKASPRSLLGVCLALVPVIAVAALVDSIAVVAAVGGGPLAALAARRWGRANLGGVSGDVYGLANELGRVVGLHAGVIAWTLS